ncbi:MAG TPA: AraC family transcriptional regulator, partial [Dyadobacter sp.]|nr:AraC family transcriptional regulator [Dyadobacter sp.]
ESEARTAIIESYLRSWFLHCLDVQKHISLKPHVDLRMQMLLELIETQYRRQRQADFYARQLSISAKRLNELTRESFGKTISQLINDRLVLEAKREIGFIEKPIKEISYELGFSEPSYFTRFFGKQTGFAPQDFRKRITMPDN